MIKHIKIKRRECPFCGNIKEILIKEFIEKLENYHTFFEDGYSQVNYIDDLRREYEKRLVK